MAKLKYVNEEILFTSLQKGDEHALEYIYQAYWPMIVKFVRENHGTQEEAADVFQEAIIVLYEKTRNTHFRLACTLKTYLYSVCRNLWLYRLRGRKYLIRDSADFLENLPGLEENDEVILPDDQKMMEAIRKLGEPCFTLLTGFYFHQRSMEYLADSLHYNSPSVAKQQKYRCVERLKKTFSQINS